MSKPTPGPWRSWEMGSEGSRITPNTGDRREDLKYIAIVNGRDTLTDFANGRLIAAAPDMYEALSSLTDLIAGDQWDEDEIDKAFALRGLGYRITRARAAVAKAECRS